MDTLGELLTLTVAPANEHYRAHAADLAEAVPEATDEPVELADVDQGYRGEATEQAVNQHGIQLHVPAFACLMFVKTIGMGICAEWA